MQHGLKHGLKLNFLLTVSGLKGKKTEQPSRSGRAGLLLSQTSVCLSCT